MHFRSHQDTQPEQTPTPCLLENTAIHCWEAVEDRYENRLRPRETAWESHGTVNGLQMSMNPETAVHTDQITAERWTQFLRLVMATQVQPNSSAADHLAQSSASLETEHWVMAVLAWK